MPGRPSVEVAWEHGTGEHHRPRHVRTARRRPVLPIAVGIVALVIALTLLGLSIRRDSAPPQLPQHADELRQLLGALGGIDAQTIAAADGPFELVTFDPEDRNRLLASYRSSYGPAENQHLNELWTVVDAGVRQELYEPDIAHDVVHFTTDGTIARWSNSGSSDGFASRTLSLDAGDEAASSAPVYAARSVIADGVLFALTSSDDYYSTQRTFRELVADRGGDVTVLDSGEAWAAVDSPVPGIVVLYPRDRGDTTRVWDTDTLEPLQDHVFAGLTYQRIAVSGDGGTAVGVTFDDELEVIEIDTGRPGERFGSLDPTDIRRPIALSRDGTTALTVDRTGVVSMWWVGDDRPIWSVEGDAGPGRLLPEHLGHRISSSVATDGSRVAIRQLGTERSPVTWTIIDTDVRSWVIRSNQ